MNEHFAPLLRESPVELARESDFELGACRVRPSLCEVHLGPRAEKLEPRVMQVLVALARAGGAVVSRDDLIASCWNGRIVGEDAINRCIGRLRRLFADPDDGVMIITVPRVGFRLQTEPEGEAVVLSEPPPARRRLPPWLFGLAGLALAGLLAGAWLHLQRRAWAVQDYRPFAAETLIERHPAFSPDGRSLAYAAGPDVESRRILIRPLHGGGARAFSSGPGDDAAPAWSPTGELIAFTRMLPGQPCLILVKPVAGGPERQVGTCSHDARTRLGWLGEGRLLFLDSRRGDGASGLRSLDIETGRVADLTRPDAAAGERDFEPVISPDRRKVAFIRQRDRLGAQLMALDLRSGRLRSLDTPGIQPNGAAWTPDGRWLIVGSERAGDYGLWLVAADGGSRPRRLLTGLRAIGRVAVSASGRMAVETDSELVNLSRFGSGADIAPANSTDMDPDYAPDGTLAFLSDRGGAKAIWLMRPGQPPVQAAELPFHRLGALRFSPDGAKIAFAVTREGEAGLYVLDFATRKVTRLQVPGLDFGAPSWAADGAALIAPVRDAHGWRLMRAPLDPQRRAVPASDYGWVSVRTAPEGLFGVRVDRPGVWRLQPDGGRVLVAPGVTATNPEDWTLWSGKVYALRRTRVSEADLYEAPLSGGPARLLGHIPRLAEGPGLAVHPATGEVVYPRIVMDDSDIGLMSLVRTR